MTPDNLEKIRKTPYPDSHSWAYNTYNRYDNFLERMDMSAKTVHQYANDCLTKFAQANEDDLAYLYYQTHNDKKITVGAIHSRFNDFVKWTLLNKLLAVNCYFENYLYSILKLSFESFPKLIDASYPENGIMWVKNGLPINIRLDTINKKTTKLINKCVIGNWQERMANIISILRVSDVSLINSFNSYIVDLDRFRDIRVKVGHFFGRDENLVHDWYNTEIPDLSTLTVDSFLDWQKNAINKFVKELDGYVMKEFVGSFQELYFYHNHKYEIEKYVDRHQQIEKFKTLLLKENKGPGAYNKPYLNNIIEYYARI